MSNAVTTRVWVSCEQLPMNYPSYKMWTYKPHEYLNFGAVCFAGGDMIRQFCAQGFESMTPIRLEPGTCKPFDITISATEVKE